MFVDILYSNIFSMMHLRIYKSICHSRIFGYVSMVLSASIPLKFVPLSTVFVFECICAFCHIQEVYFFIISQRVRNIILFIPYYDYYSLFIILLLFLIHKEYISSASPKFFLALYDLKEYVHYSSFIFILYSLYYIITVNLSSSCIYSFSTELLLWDFNSTLFIFLSHY